MNLGTRKSALALAQSGQVAALIGPDVKLVGVVTEGDRLVDVPLQGPLAKGYFTAELERQLLEGQIDLAVHSLKDLPVAEAAGLTLGAIPRRASPADLLLVRPSAWAPEAPGLPLIPGARVGAASLRRQLLLRTVRHDLQPEFLRGNVTTRLRRLADGDFDAILLAEAGIGRLGADLSPFRVARLSPDHWPPAPGQGALAIQCRAGDEATLARLKPLHDPDTARAVFWERRMLSALGGGCATPFGALYRSDARGVLAVAVGEEMRLRGGFPSGEGEAVLKELLGDDRGEGFSGLSWEPFQTT